MAGMKGKQFTETDLYDGPFTTAERSILYVCATPQRAKDRWLQMGRPDNIRMGYPGMAVAGAGFDEIILDDIYGDSSKVPIVRGNISAWVENLRCRLYPEGRMRTIIKQRKIA